MWYDNGSTTALVDSLDGINWANQVALNLADVHHPLVEYYPTGFTGVNSGSTPSNMQMYYRLWYWYPPDLYSVGAIRYAESANGSIWYNDQPLQNGAVPIIEGEAANSWNRGSYGPADVLYDPGALNTGTNWKFTMYYDGTTGGIESIGLAFSADGITWTGYDSEPDAAANPVLTGTGASGDWDYNFVSRATVIKNSATDYQMWYSGGNNTMHAGIGYAISSDGIHWLRQGRVFYIGDNVSWRNLRTYCPMVIRFATSYSMWYAGFSSDSKYSIG